MSWVEDLGSMIEAASLGTGGIDLFYWRPPEEPHNLVVLIPYGGARPERTHSGTERRFPRLQVLARNKHGNLAFDKAEDIRAFLRDVEQVEVGSTVYEAIIPLTEPLALARDTIGRFPYIVNYEVRFHGG